MARIILILLVLSFTQAADYANNRIIVKVKNTNVGAMAIGNSIPRAVQEYTAKNQGTLRELNNKTKLKISAEMGGSAGLANVYVITIAPTENILEVVKGYAALSGVAYAEPDYLAKIFITPTDNPTYYAIQKYDTYDAIGAEKAWDVCTGDVSVIVGILDTGVSLSHVDLAANISPTIGWNYYGGNTNVNDDNNYSYNNAGITVNAFGHGTQVAGAIAAVGNNGIGITGVCWRTTLIVGKVFDASGTDARYSDIAQAIIDGADTGVKVINMSFGGTPFSQTLKDACDYAYYQKDVVLVAAMGNSGDNSIFYPAGFDSVIGVGSVNNAGTQRSSFSTYGAGNQTTEIVAPGENVLSTCAFTQGLLLAPSTHGAYNQASGTSFSAPKVSGVCALLRAKYPTLKNTQIRDILHYSSIDLGTTGYDSYYGYGLVNAENALNRASTLVSNKSITDIYNFPNPVREGKTRFSFRSEKSIQSSEFTIYDLRGRALATLTAGGSIFTNGGIYKTGEWDCHDSNGCLLPNGTYIYTIKAIDVNGGEHIAKGKMAIVR